VAAISNLVQFSGTGKKPENKNQKGRSRKSLRDLNCVTAGASKGTSARVHFAII